MPMAPPEETLCPKMTAFMAGGYDGQVGNNQLVNGSPRFNVYSSGSWVKLPDARTLRTGGEQFLIGQTVGSFAIKDYNNTELAWPSDTQACICCLIDNTTSAGIWTFMYLSFWLPA